MFTWSIFILILSCSEHCLFYSLLSNYSQTGYLHRESRQVRTCKTTERLCQSGECYPKRVFCDGVVDCADGSDETSICSRTCNPLVSSTVDIKCTRNGLHVDCMKPVLHGTLAEVSCKQHYHLPPYDGIPSPYNHLICENGIWDFNLLECVPVCGTRNPQRRKRIILGAQANLGEFPWHVGIHKQSRLSDTTYGLICGGSIIHSKAVITALTCVKMKVARLYRVGAGKFYRDWNDARDENAQLRNVEQIHFPEGHKETYTIEQSYANDMAIIIVDKPFVFNDFVRPICVVDWTRETEIIDNRTLIDNAIGYVPGWGQVNNFGEYSEILKFILLQITPEKTCIDFIKDYIPSLAFKDKICVGRTDGTNQTVCQGDIGGGLAVQLGEVYYLMAIVSITAVKQGFCDASKYTIITKFSYYAQWVHSITRQQSPGT